MKKEVGIIFLKIEFLRKRCIRNHFLLRHSKLSKNLNKKSIICIQFIVQKWHNFFCLQLEHSSAPPSTATTTSSSQLKSLFFVCLLFCAECKIDK